MMADLLLRASNHSDSVVLKRILPPILFIARGLPTQSFTISIPIVSRRGLIDFIYWLSNAYLLNNSKDCSLFRPSKRKTGPVPIIDATNSLRVVTTILLPLAPPNNGLLKLRHNSGTSFHTSSRTSKYFFPSISFSRLDCTLYESLSKLSSLLFLRSSNIVLLMF
ncbi:hypothetical protein CFOL_v3_10539 [Cephalotus follicularis]|uniref:Uncharacterized protein n=1 Tax=Cephalotus follicularis TaxID=3775 RepID=A0A1Q3BG96_CEPFO|nr:hypothetical protein CFOL_v3_10539 [Cephalotus follicularis]